MSLSDSWMKHQTLAVLFWNQGKHREAATNNWLSFKAIPHSTHEWRYYIFTSYSSNLRKAYFDATDDDLKNLEQVFRDKHEPRLFRLEAGYTLGVISYDRSERLKCQEYYHHAITIGDKPPKNSKQERLEQKKMTWLTPGGERTQKTMKELQDVILTTCQSNLSRLNRSTGESTSSLFEHMVNEAAADVANMSTSSDPQKKTTHSMPIGRGGTTLTDEEFNNLIDVGGLRCDCCKSEVEKLLVCERCKKAYYCSAECQKEQWKNNGHKIHCRKDGEFKADDLVQIARLKNKPELNDKIYRVVGPDKNNVGRYEVRMEGAVRGDKSFSVAAGNLNQLRPYDCRQ